MIHKIFEDSFKELDSYTKDLKSKKVLGVTTGIERLDSLVGRIERGSIWIIGGYSGTGKSFFVLNMVDGIIKEAISKKTDPLYRRPNIAIFSTELSVTEYMKRHIFMRMGIYKLQLQSDPYNHDFLGRYETELKKYKQERLLNPFVPSIYGGIQEYEQIEKIIANMEQQPDLIFIDYVQELTTKEGSKTLYREEDAMPAIASKLLKMARNKGISVVVLSQVNNYMVNADSKTNKLVPFSFGKQLNQAADVSIVLNRERKDGELSKFLEAEVLKSRNGDYGTLAFRIMGGYQLKYENPNHERY